MSSKSGDEPESPSKNLNTTSSNYQSPNVPSCSTINQQILQEILEPIGLINHFPKFKDIECSITALMKSTKQQFLGVCSLIGLTPFETVRFQQALLSYFHDTKSIPTKTNPAKLIPDKPDIYDQVLLKLYTNLPEHSKHDTDTLCTKLLQAKQSNQLSVPVLKYFQDLAENTSNNNTDITEALISVIGQEFNNEQFSVYFVVLLNLVERDEYLLLDRALLFRLCEMVIHEMAKANGSDGHNTNKRLKFSKTLLEQSENCLRNGRISGDQIVQKDSSTSPSQNIVNSLLNLF
jgi:hypothetical protein